MPRMLFVGLLFMVLYSGCWASFHRKIKQHETASNKAFHDSLLQQLANHRNASSPVLGDDVRLVSNTTSESLITGTNSFAAADDTLQVYLSSTLPVNPAPPQSCSNALIAPVNCNSTISLMAMSPLILGNNDDLQIVCTAACTASLISYRASVVSACSGFNVASNNVTYPPTFAVDSILGPYTVQCLQDPETQQFCTPLLASYNATGGLLALPTPKLCTFCTLKTLNATLSNPSTFSAPLASLLSSAIGICGSQFAYNISTASPSQVTTGPGSTFGVNSTLAPASDCAITGRNVSAPSNTTCQQLATQFSVSDNDILAANPFLDVGCKVVAGSHLCIPQSCHTYVLQTNDTCDSVSAAAGSQTGVNITSVQLQSFNPELGTYCQLMALRVGQKICLTPNGGFPSVIATAAAVPSATPTTQAAIPTPTVNGTTSACGRFYQVQDRDLCNSVVLKNSVSLDDFLVMNPEIDANCTNLWLGYFYCIAPFPPFTTISSRTQVSTNYSTATIMSFTLPTSYTPTFATQTLDIAGVPAPTNVANGTRTVACGFYYNVSAGDTLDSISSTVGINASDLVTWNPELSSAPPPVDSAICVIFPTGNYTLPAASPPANIAPTTTTNCAQFHTVQAGDGCNTIPGQFGITLSQFLSLNPGLNPQCTNLVLRVAYCVFPTTPFSTNTSTGPPPNAAPGTITQGCTQYYTVVSGDSCPAVEAKFNLTLAQFVAMNPEINSQCSNLALDEAYCVNSSNSTSGGGTSGPPPNVAPGTITAGCTTYYTIVSGDSCALVETKFNLTLVQFVTMNPEINSDCTNLILGEAYCVTSSNSTSGGGTNPSGPPSNLASGSLSNCTSYYTVVSGDDCGPIEGKFKIAPSDFFRWNPEVNTACSNIAVGEAYCVGGGGNACKKTYTVQSGDFCFAITQSQGITQAQLNALNPQIDTNCDLSIGEILCVG